MYVRCNASGKFLQRDFYPAPRLRSRVYVRRDRLQVFTSLGTGRASTSPFFLHDACARCVFVLFRCVPSFFLWMVRVVFLVPQGGYLTRGGEGSLQVWCAVYGV